MYMNLQKVKAIKLFMTWVNINMRLVMVLIPALLLILLNFLPQQVHAQTIESLTPISHWTCDEASGVRYDSNLTNTNDLTDVNTVASVVGLLGNACDFERANSEYLSIGDASQVGLDFTTGEFSFSWWSKPETVIGTIINKYLGSASQRSYQISYGAQMDLWACATSSGASCVNSVPNSFLTVGTWKHHVVSYSINTDLFKYYVNGVIKSSTSTPMISLYNGTADFIIGTNNGTNYYDGLLDEITAFDYDLSDAQVTTLYNSGVPLDYSEPEVIVSQCLYSNPSSMYPIEELSCTTDGATTTCDYQYGTTTVPVVISSDDIVFALALVVFFLATIWFGFVVYPFKKN